MCSPTIFSTRAMVDSESRAGPSRRLPDGVKGGVYGAGSHLQHDSAPIRSQKPGVSPPASTAIPLRIPPQLERPILDAPGSAPNEPQGASSISLQNCAPMSSKCLHHGLGGLELDGMGVGDEIRGKHSRNVKASLDEALNSCIGSCTQKHQQVEEKHERDEDPDATPKAEKIAMDLHHQTQRSIHGSETTSPSMSSMCLSPTSSCISDSSPSERSDPSGWVHMSESWSEKTPTNEIQFSGVIFEEEGDRGECSTARITSFAPSLFASSSESDSEDEADDEQDETRSRKENIVFSDDELNNWSDSDDDDSDAEQDDDVSESEDENEGDEINGGVEIEYRSRPLLAPPISPQACSPPTPSPPFQSIFVAASFRSDSSSDDGDRSERDDPDEDDALYLPQSPWFIESSPVARPSVLPDKAPYRSPPRQTSPSCSRSISPPSQGLPAPAPPPQKYECPPSPPIPRYVMAEAPALPVYETHRPIPIRFPVYPSAYYASHYTSVSYSAQGSSCLTNNHPLGGTREMSETERLDEEWAKKEEQKLREEEEDRERIRKYAQEYSIGAYRL
ncbi:hypothetical protein IAR50_003028 [Cryptococcus sp. DSM 104548]